MNLTLNPIETRILGCLIEKEATTPDVYPLTLNSLLLACNQKSSREPVMELLADDLQPALDSLIEKTLVSTWKASHNKMAKYKHRLRDRISDKFDFEVSELAVLGVLFLRGPQTVGEIRTRCSRIHEFDSLETVNGVLAALQANPDGPYVTVLPRQEGRKEQRFMHLFGGEPADIDLPGSGSLRATAGSGSRVEALELEVSELKSALQSLEQKFEEFKREFE